MRFDSCSWWCRLSPESSSLTAPTDVRFCRCQRASTTVATAMKLHSALQAHLDGECRAAGKATFILNQTPPYDGLYKVYCSKKRDHILVQAVVEGSNKAIVHMSFGRDAYIRGNHIKLASDKPEDACTCSMHTAQVAMVAQGEDICLEHCNTWLLGCILRR